MKPRLAAPGFRLGNIEVIRGIAALMVVVTHAAGVLAARGAHLGPTAHTFEFGVSGVDLFFVISGFVIVWTQLGTARGTWAFFKNRVRRIVPMYWILTILAFGVTLASRTVNIPIEGQDASAKGVIGSLLFVSRPLGFDYPVLYQGWTLEYEMLFYLLFASTLFLRRTWITIASTAVAIVGLALFTSVSNRLVEFVLGMAVAVATNFLPAPPRWLARTMLIVGAVAFLATSQIEWSSYPFWVVWGIPSALIIYGAANIRQAHNRVGTELGSASYAVYLIQWFTVPAIAMLVEITNTRLQWVFLVWGILIVLVTQFAGIVFTRRVDKPITRWLRAKGF